MSKKFGFFHALMLLGPLWSMNAYSSFNGARYVEGEVLVKLKSDKQLENVINNKDLSMLNVDRTVDSLGGRIFVLKYDQKGGRKMEEIISALKGSPDVEVAEPNFIYSLSDHQFQGQMADSPNDPLFAKLWGLHNTGSNEPSSSKMNGVSGADIKALDAWEIHKGDRRIKVAVIDTGIDYNHPDLVENIWVNEAEKNGLPGVDDDGNGYVDDVYGYDFANNDNDPMDGHGHGTHCAGTIGAVHDNGVGVAGVMGEVSLVGIKFLGDNGSGSTDGAIRAIDYATKLNVDVMSNSWGGGGYSQLLKDAIERAKEKGIVFVAAAGNSSQNNDDRPNYPSNYPVENVIAVAAHTHQDQLASFSSYGQRTVHVAAPGKNVISTVRNGGYAVYSGTSMATPHVSGAVGLLLAKEGRLDVNQLRERVVLTSSPVRSLRRKTQSNGRLNAFNLLKDERPVRNEPRPEEWQRIALDTPFESKHPYGANENFRKSFHVPGAKYIRVLVSKYDLESRYDFLRIRNSSNKELVEELSGKGENYLTDYVEGDRIEVEMTSDASVHLWGFKIEALEYVREN